MKVIFAGLMVLALGGCNKGAPASADNPQAMSKGRYAGVGVFEAGRLWGKMMVPQAKADEDTARLSDDEHVIVVIDSQTGEIRQCGDHTGYCVSISPWDKANGAGLRLPVKLGEHADDHASVTEAASSNPAEK